MTERREKPGFASGELLHIVSNSVWNKMRNSLELEFSEESGENLSKFNELLFNDPGVLYINHTSMRDAPLAISMALSQLPNAKQIIGPAGMKHYDWKRDPFSAAALRSLKLVNINVLPVVQINDEVDYGRRRLGMLEELKEKTAEMISRRGSLYGIAPEGTRSKKDGALLRSNRGIGYLAEHENLYYLPVAIMYKEFTEKPGVVVGIPKRLDEIIPPDYSLPEGRKEKAQAIADIHMERLAELMPKELRGAYATSLGE